MTLPQLTDPDRALLSFLAESDRFLYDFLDTNLLSDYQIAAAEMGRLLTLGWISTGWSEEQCITYRITDLGRKCLETGLQLEVSAEARSRFSWKFPTK